MSFLRGFKTENKTHTSQSRTASYRYLHPRFRRHCLAQPSSSAASSPAEAATRRQSCRTRTPSSRHPCSTPYLQRPLLLHLRKAHLDESTVWRMCVWHEGTIRSKQTVHECIKQVPFETLPAANVWVSISSSASELLFVASSLFDSIDCPCLELCVVLSSDCLLSRLCVFTSLSVSSSETIRHACWWCACCWCSRSIW